MKDLVKRLRGYYSAEDVREAADRIEELEEVLQEVREFVEGQSDVVDGSYGIPRPNRAMQLSARITEILGP